MSKTINQSEMIIPISVVDCSNISFKEAKSAAYSALNYLLEAQEKERASIRDCVKVLIAAQPYVQLSIQGFVTFMQNNINKRKMNREIDELIKILSYVLYFYYFDKDYSKIESTDNKLRFSIKVNINGKERIIVDRCFNSEQCIKESEEYQKNGKTFSL